MFTFIYAYTYLKLNPSLVSHPRVSHAMAPVAVVDKSSKPSWALSHGEVEMILKRAGIEETAFQGRGGILMVVSVAVFSSLAGLLTGLDIGCIAGVKTMGFAIHRTGHHYHDLRSGCRHRGLSSHHGFLCRFAGSPKEP